MSCPDYAPRDGPQVLPKLQFSLLSMRHLPVGDPRLCQLCVRPFAELCMGKGENNAVLSFGNRN